LQIISIAGPPVESTGQCRDRIRQLKLRILRVHICDTESKGTDAATVVFDSTKQAIMSKTAKGGDKLQQKSPAEFFAENKNIAGFDNVSLLFLRMLLKVVDCCRSSSSTIHRAVLCIVLGLIPSVQLATNGCLIIELTAVASATF